MSQTLQHDILFYYSGSADKPPGKGVNEYVRESNKYAELAMIPNWRRILSNFYVSPFILDIRGKGPITSGPHRYNSAEHAFQGMKISIADKSKGYLFSLDSDSQLSKGSGDDARRQRKMVILNASQLGEWNRIQDQILGDILYAKFSQVPIAQKVLLATRDAELWHGTRGSPKARQYILEQVREKLHKDPSVLANALANDNIRTIQGYVNKDNIVSIIAYLKPKDIIPVGSYMYMKSMDLRPEIFQSLLNPVSTGITDNPLIFDIWKKVLANAIVIDNAPLVQQLIGIFKDKITPSMLQNMIKLSEKSPKSREIIQTLG